MCDSFQRTKESENIQYEIQMSKNIPTRSGLVVSNVLAVGDGQTILYLDFIWYYLQAVCRAPVVILLCIVRKVSSHSYIFNISNLCQNVSFYSRTQSTRGIYCKAYLNKNTTCYNVLAFSYIASFVWYFSLKKEWEAPAGTYFIYHRLITCVEHLRIYTAIQLIVVQTLNI